MRFISAENRLRCIEQNLADSLLFIERSSGTSKKDIEECLIDIDKMLTERNTLLAKLNSIKNSTKFDDNLTVYQAELLVKELIERANINLKAALCMPTTPEFKTNNFSLYKYLEEMKRMRSLASDIEEKLYLVKFTVDVDL